MKKLLLHVCCGPCSIMPVTRLREAGFAVSGYFYNPNIHPLKEYLRRREAMFTVAAQMQLELITDDDYDSAKWFAEAMQQASSKPNGRCHYCYTVRFTRCLQKAHELGFDYFSSSLLYSRRQNHQLIRQAAEEVQANSPHFSEQKSMSGSSSPPGGSFACSFYYSDFRDDWQQGIELSKNLDIYRQNYCGCLFSENERFANELKKVTKHSEAIIPNIANKGN